MDITLSFNYLINIINTSVPTWTDTAQVNIYGWVFIFNKLVHETITSKANQDDIKSDIKLQYECTMSQSFNMITHLAIAL